MKTVIGIFLIALSVFFSQSFAGPSPEEAVKVLSTKRYVFYFKVEKRLIGGTVEIYDECQEMVGSETIDQARKIVDFFYRAPGTYAIKIKKDSEEFTFTYVNRE